MARTPEHLRYDLPKPGDLVSDANPVVSERQNNTLNQ